MKRYTLPAILSIFIPGLGQLIKGHILKAIFVWVGSFLVGFFLWWTYVVPFLFWAWNVYDAYNSNK